MAYHFDRSQLEYPPSVACRNRIEWIVSQIAPLVEAEPKRKLRILDLGIGGAPIETRLVKLMPGALLEIVAVDIESKALESLSKKLRSTTCQVQAHRLDLRQESSARQVAALAQGVDVCIAVGILEALRDEDAEPVLRAIRQALPKRGVLYAENFVPDHPNRKVMEWFMDFHLGYRSADAFRALLIRAGFDASLVEVKVESTGSIALVRATV